MKTLEHPRKYKGIAVAFALISLGVVAYLDNLTGTEMSFSIFYLIPITLITWYAGLLSGICMSFDLFGHFRKKRMDAFPAASV